MSRESATWTSTPEARGLGIPTIALIDTDGDPDLVDIPIPGNDDSMRSIDVVVRELCEAVTAGKAGQTAEGESERPAEEPAQTTGRRRSSRSMFRAEQPSAEPPKTDAAPEPAPPAEAAPVEKPVAPAPAIEPRSDTASTIER
ncbi:MAG: 30S ribosomal protein S2, partial [Planctomycetota bacterium]